MGPFHKLIDMLTLGSDRPVRRLIAYYVLLGLVVYAVNEVWTDFDARLTGSEIVRVDTPELLQDGLTEAPTVSTPIKKPPPLTLLASVTMMLVGTVLLMLPVSWVYMSTRNSRSHNQGVVQTLIILPIVVAGIVIIVQDSLALAFSLAGVVAAVRFRTTLKDARDTVYIFLAIAVGFAAGVQALPIAALLSVFFNVVVIFTWRYDFGHNVLEAQSSTKWVEPLSSLANQDADTEVPDRDLVLALTPESADILAARFDRVRDLLGKKKTRFNAVLRLTTDAVTETQRMTESLLDDTVKRWQLDQVVSMEGKPSELIYLVRIKKSMTEDEFLTAVRGRIGGLVPGVRLEAGESLNEQEDG
ncbi:MAG: DUF4956 domain-containing protein [Gemmatimonadales bacterium]